MYEASLLSSFLLQRQVLRETDTRIPSVVIELVQDYTLRVCDSQGKVAEIMTQVISRASESFENIPQPIHDL